MIHYLLFSIIKHKCLSFDINSTAEKSTITDLIKLLTPYIHTLRTKCTNCHLLSDYISIAEISHLMVLNKQNQLTLAIDMHVYSKNQQFRLFDSIKKNKNNPLVLSTYYPFNNCTTNSYFDIIEKSLVTNTKNIHVPIVCLAHNEFIFKINDTISSSIYFDSNLYNFTFINTHLNAFYLQNQTDRPTTCYNNAVILKNNITTTIDQNDDQINQFIPFIDKLIKSDKLHQGYISSCVRGNYNKDLLFFNIGGHYRYCPRIGSHHRSNTTAIIIDLNNQTYTIRCKDRDCNNKLSVWNIIE